MHCRAAPCTTAEQAVFQKSAPTLISFFNSPTLPCFNPLIASPNNFPPRTSLSPVSHGTLSFASHNPSSLGPLELFPGPSNTKTLFWVLTWICLHQVIKSTSPILSGLTAGCYIASLRLELRVPCRQELCWVLSALEPTALFSTCVP